jgi:beta-glucosidase
MPGPTRWRGQALGQSISANKISTFKIEDRVRNVLNLVKRCKESGVKENQREVTRNSPEDAALLRKIAADSIVLMKNDKGVLPLRKHKSVRVSIHFCHDHTVSNKLNRWS